jgi:hypothetical protein
VSAEQDRALAAAFASCDAATASFPALRIWDAATERDMINLLSAAEGTHWTGTIHGPAEDGWMPVYTFEGGRCTDRYLTKAWTRTFLRALENEREGQL